MPGKEGDNLKFPLSHAAKNCDYIVLYCQRFFKHNKKLIKNEKIRNIFRQNMLFMRGEGETIKTE